MVLQTRRRREPLSQIEYIKLTPSTVKKIRIGASNRPVSNWLRNNGMKSISKKVVFWGIRKTSSEKILFAITFGLTEGEVSKMIADKKTEMNANSAYIDSYLIGKTALMPDTINELGDDFDPYLDDVLLLAGKNDFTYLSMLVNPDGTPAAGHGPNLHPQIEKMLNIQK